MNCRSTLTATTPGDIGKLDYERLDLQLAQYESDESNAEMNLVQASDQLQTLLGIGQPSRSFDVAGDLVPPPLSATLTDLEQKALTARPDYQAAQAAVRVADANVKLAYANGTTDPTLEGEYDRSGDVQFVSASVSAFRCGFSIVTRATKTPASTWRKRAGSAR